MRLLSSLTLPIRLKITPFQHLETPDLVRITLLVRIPIPPRGAIVYKNISVYTGTLETRKGEKDLGTTGCRKRTNGVMRTTDPNQP